MTVYPRRDRTCTSAPKKTCTLSSSLAACHARCDGGRRQRRGRWRADGRPALCGSRRRPAKSAVRRAADDAAPSRKHVPIINHPAMNPAPVCTEAEPQRQTVADLNEMCRSSGSNVDGGGHNRRMAPPTRRTDTPAAAEVAWWRRRRRECEPAAAIHPRAVHGQALLRLRGLPLYRFRERVGGIIGDFRGGGKHDITKRVMTGKRPKRHDVPRQRRWWVRVRTRGWA